MKIVILDGYTTNPGDLSWDFLNEFGTYTVYEAKAKDGFALDVVEKTVAGAI